jgi:acetoin utilization deacetylase AcuC-like enzyme
MGLRIYHNPRHAEHDPGAGHPERPARIDACIQAIPPESELVTAEPAEQNDLARVHDPSYLSRLEKVCDEGGGWIDPDTFAGPDSYTIAASAVGAACSAVEDALSSGRRSFCLVRPPGHHAGPSNAMGFCLLNNLAIGAAKALEIGVERVMVIDFDVHHGNGTQGIFWDEPRVLYLSVHQWPWYPWRTGSLEEVGGSGALGTNVNLPLPAGSGDAEFLAAMSAVVVPSAVDFGPDLILLSAGFDAHELDPLSQLKVTTAGFEAVVSASVALAEELCGGRLVATLEGGYDLVGLSESVAASVEALDGAGRAQAQQGPIPAPVASAASFHQGIRADRSR